MNNTHLIEEIQKNVFDIEEYKTGNIEIKSNIEITQNAIAQLSNDIQIKNENENKKKKMIEEKEKEIINYNKLLNILN